MFIYVLVYWSLYVLCVYLFVWVKNQKKGVSNLEGEEFIKLRLGTFCQLWSFPIFKCYHISIVIVAIIIVIITTIRAFVLQEFRLKGKVKYIKIQWAVQIFTGNSKTCLKSSIVSQVTVFHLYWYSVYFFYISNLFFQCSLEVISWFVNFIPILVWHLLRIHKMSSFLLSFNFNSKTHLS